MTNEFCFMLMTWLGSILFVMLSPILFFEHEHTIMDFIRKHLVKGFKFCLIGSVGAAINLSIQYVLVEFLSIYFLFASIIGILGGMFFNYFLNYYWTFKGGKEG